MLCYLRKTITLNGCNVANLTLCLIQKTEPWEHEKEVTDREQYIWEGSPSQEQLQVIQKAQGGSIPEEIIREYEEVVVKLLNEGKCC